jgi:hypothetical protein
MTSTNSFCSKYTNVLTNNTAAEANLASGADIEQSINSGARRPRVSKDKDRIENQGKLEKVRGHPNDPSLYVRCTILSVLKQKHNCNRSEERGD